MRLEGGGGGAEMPEGKWGVEQCQVHFTAMALTRGQCFEGCLPGTCIWAVVAHKRVRRRLEGQIPLQLRQNPAPSPQNVRLLGGWKNTRLNERVARGKPGVLVED